MKRMNCLFFAFDKVNYKKWSLLDLAIKQSNYPADLKDLFENKHVWRGNFTTNIGGYMPIDQFHEQAKLVIFCKFLLLSFQTFSLHLHSLYTGFQLAIKDSDLDEQTNRRNFGEPRELASNAGKTLVRIW